MCFLFFFLLFGPLLFSKLLTFSFLVHFKWFKVLWEHHPQFYKSSFNSNSNKATCKNFFECLGIDFVMFCWFVFLRSWVLSSLLGEGGEACTFSILILFDDFEWVRCVNRKGSSFVWTPETMKPSLGSALPWALKCSLTSRSTLHW